MSLVIKNWQIADWKELLKWAKIGANNAMIGEFTEVEEVPPHGRLIQDDALDKIEHYHDGTFGLTDYERGWNAALLLCKKRIEAAPTIIEAEEE